MKIRISCPGSLMLMGEYAVLYGKSSLVIAINKRVYVQVCHSAENSIESDLYGRHTNVLPKQLLLIKTIKDAIAPNITCSIKIESEFSDKIGFGSSGAVISAVVAALLLFTKKIENIKDNKHIILSHARKYAAGLSGSDLAASIYGSIVYYDITSGVKEVIQADELSIYTMFSGVKKISSEAVKEFEQRRINNPDIYNHIFNLAQIITTKSYIAIKEKKWRELGMLMNLYNGVHQSIGANTAKLEELLHLLREVCYGAKISGAGYGDSVIGITTEKLKERDNITLLNIDNNGVTEHS